MKNGWPSGFADGRVPRKGEAYQQKRMEFREIGELGPEDRVLGYFCRQDGRCTRPGDGGGRRLCGDSDCESVLYRCAQP